MGTDHANGFEQEPGVEVMGAGDTQVNGGYHRMEHAEGPPRGWLAMYSIPPIELDYRELRPTLSLDSAEGAWAEYNAGQPWYEKDNGCFIYQNQKSLNWNICAPNGHHRYMYGYTGYTVFVGEGSDPQPPTEGWGSSHPRFFPRPTLRVVP